MITYAKLKHIRDPKFIKLHSEITKYHSDVNYFFDWSRQYEYPYLLQKVPFLSEDEILDAGGGTCHFPTLMAKRVKQVTVGDIYHERMFKTDAKNVDFLKLNISSDIPDKQYDIVTCVSVLEHIDNWLEAVNNLQKAVKPGGYLAMTLDLFFDNFKPCKAEDVPKLIDLLSSSFDVSDVDLSEDDLYQKITLQKMKLDMPNLYSNNYPNRGILVVIVKKKDE